MVADSHSRALPADFEVLITLQHPEFVQEFSQSGDSSEVLRIPVKCMRIIPVPGNEVQRVIGTEDQWVVAHRRAEWVEPATPS